MNYKLYDNAAVRMFKNENRFGLWLMERWNYRPVGAGSRSSFGSEKKKRKKTVRHPDDWRFVYLLRWTTTGRGATGRTRPRTSCTAAIFSKASTTTPLPSIRISGWIRLCEHGNIVQIIYERYCFFFFLERAGSRWFSRKKNGKTVLKRECSFYE